MKNKSNDNTNLYILLGILLIAVIIGTILGKSYYDKTRENFAASDKKRLVYLFSSSCNFCTLFNPTWDSIVTEVKNNPKSYTFDTEKYDVSSQIGADYADLNKITALPAILFVSYKTSNEYSDPDRSKDKILKWASDFVKNLK